MFHSSRVHFVWVRLLSAICRLLIRSVGGPQTPDHYIERLKVASRLIKSSRISTDLECRENIHLFQPFSFFCFKRILRKSWRGVLFFFFKKKKGKWFSDENGQVDVSWPGEILVLLQMRQPVICSDAYLFPPLHSAQTTRSPSPLLTYLSIIFNFSSVCPRVCPVALPTC